MRRRTHVLKGQRVAITGPLCGPLAGMERTTAYSLIADSGGEVCTAVSGTTTLLVASRVDTAKFSRAIGLGIPIVNSSWFAEMLGFLPLWWTPANGPARLTTPGNLPSAAVCHVEPAVRAELAVGGRA